MPPTSLRARPDRLDPRYYSAERLPPAVAPPGSAPDTLAVGFPAQVGILGMGFAVRGGRTDLAGC
ncbi:hypothetical protein ACFY7Z_26015 [Streptomyces sp. NPDC012623]|uniref:hypothetical protein n=1 Tax=unclassified Streptomyces TaxID=2593676 RepID=UPI00367B29F9